MELTIDYITEHKDDFLPKENINYCGTVPNYHYNSAHGDWTTTNFSVWTDSEVSDFKKWYKENIVPVWAFMPEIVNGKISGKVIRGFIMDDHMGLQFTSEQILNSKYSGTYGHTLEFDAINRPEKHVYYDYSTFHMFDNRKEAEEMYQKILGTMIGDASAIRVRDIEVKIKELNKQMKKLKAEKAKLLKK